MWKVQWHIILLCRKYDIKKVLLFLLSCCLFCSREPIRKWYIHWLSLSHWQKALESRLGSNDICTYGFFYLQDNQSQKLPTETFVYVLMCFWQTLQLLASAKWPKSVEELRIHSKRAIRFLKMITSAHRKYSSVPLPGFKQTQTEVNWAEFQTLVYNIGTKRQFYCASPASLAMP